MPIYRSSSSEETKQLGTELAKVLRNQTQEREALVVALAGDLGAGKTTFIKGFFKGLGMRDEATSPTFIIMRRMSIKKSAFTDVFHIDTYRLKSAEDLLKLDFEEVIQNPAHLVLIEWPEKVEKYLPKGTLWLHFSHGENPEERTIRGLDFFSDRSPRKEKPRAPKKK